MKNELLNKLSKIKGYQPRKERVKLFSGNLLVWVNDNGFLESTSYGWWEIVHNKKGLYFFNDYRYSISTSKHQHEMWKIMRDLGLEYISVAYHSSKGFYRNGGLADISIETILQDKIDSLYTGENKQSLRRQNAYSVYTEGDFNETMKDIVLIAKALKLSQSKLDKMLIDAENKANNELIETLVTQHERRVTRRALQKQNENLSAIQL